MNHRVMRIVSIGCMIAAVGFSIIIGVVAKRSNDARDEALSQARAEKTLFCARAADNLDSLITSRQDRPEVFRERAAGAEWFIIDAVRLCTSKEPHDYADAIIGRQDEDIVQALQNMKSAL